MVPVKEFIACPILQSPYTVRQFAPHDMAYAMAVKNYRVYNLLIQKLIFSTLGILLLDLTD